jgi:hypothetical protein
MNLCIENRAVTSAKLLRKHLTKHLRLEISLLLLSSISLAQSGSKMTNKKRGLNTANYFDLNVNFGIPQQNFANTTTSLPAGVTLNILYRFAAKRSWRFLPQP